MSDDSLTRRGLLRASATAGAVSLLGTAGAHDGHSSPIPEAADGYRVEPFAPLKLPTALTFGPGTNGTPDLYATTIPRSGYESQFLPAGQETIKEAVGDGTVERVQVEYTPAGPVTTGTSTVVEGLSLPLGLAFDDSGELFVTDNRITHPAEDLFRNISRVYHVGDDGTKTAIVDQLPAGLHDTNHIEFGPDGDLYIAVGSATCNGASLGPREILPYNGSILRVDTDARRADPATLYWTDGNGTIIEHDAADGDFVNREIARHPRNDAFNDKVDVVARGFRNIYGLTFGPDGELYTGRNGSQTPTSQDTFYRLDDIGASSVPSGNPSRRLSEFADVPHYGFPYVFNETAAEGPGEGGETEDIVLKTNPEYEDTALGIDPEDYIPADGLMGWHVCAVGLDFPREGQYAFPEKFHGDPYIGECGAFEAQNSIERTMQSQDTRNTGRKVTHVYLNDDYQPQRFQDFFDGFSLITDVQFGPEGAMYIADADYGAFVAQPTPATGQGTGGLTARLSGLL